MPGAQHHFHVRVVSRMLGPCDMSLRTAKRPLKLKECRDFHIPLAVLSLLDLLTLLVEQLSTRREHQQARSMGIVSKAKKGKHLHAATRKSQLQGVGLHFWRLSAP